MIDKRAIRRYHKRVDSRLAARGKRFDGNRWEEDKHPRAKDGKFASGNGGPSKQSESKPAANAAGSAKTVAKSRIELDGPSGSKGFADKYMASHPNVAKEASKYRGVLNKVKTFKADEDGLATKCQRIANERWFKAEEHIGKLTAENNRLEDENENLRNEIAALSDRVDKLNSQIEELPTATLEVTEPEITIQSIRAAIQQAYQDAAHDDCTGDQILHMVWGFEYLLQRLGVE